MAFRKKSATPKVAETPEELFRDLPAKGVQGLLSQQADVLRNYVGEAINCPDVAIGLPTGSGKTLVGLLIAEWRRQRDQLRPLYLCPTNQLVHQVAALARASYGLDVTTFTGSKHGYPPREKTAWLTGKTVAVTSYSALFNVKPFFESPGIIVLDDAHAAENYIAQAWSLEIDRLGPTESLFTAISNLIGPKLSSLDRKRLSEDSTTIWDASWIDMLPCVELADVKANLISLIDAYIESLDLRFVWSCIRDHLHACHLYLAPHRFLIRPLIPPTATHKPFSTANQRIYMSATLGANGDLERLTGRSRIHRIQPPRGYTSHGIGQRFFVFPESALDEAGCQELTQKLYMKAGRSLHLVPSEREATKVRDTAMALNFETFSGPELEESKIRFVEMDRAVAVVANRYDGIDLPGDDCRTIILDGLPGATNLQERFLVSKMAAGALLNDRINTRILQAVGRCTRSATDYAAVIVLGTELTNRLIRPESRGVLDRELQGELEFGLTQSQDIESVDEFLENLENFWHQTDAWRSAQQDIVEYRNEAVQVDQPGRNDLRETVPDEVDYQNAMWDGEFERALGAAREVITALNDQTLRGYRALWNYLAGTAAFWAAKANDSMSQVARDYFASAAQAAPALPWMKRLSKYGIQEAAPQPTRSTLDSISVEAVERNLLRLGLSTNRKFDQREKKILEGLEGSAAEFEAAQVELGKMLGYSADNAETSGAPDPWWLIEDRFCVVFEDHSEANPGSSLSLKKARQVSSHPAWCRANLPIQADATILPVLISPVAKADQDALPHLAEVYHWPLDQYKSWVKKCLSLLRDLRSSLPGEADLFWRDDAWKKLKATHATPTALENFLQRKSAQQLLT